MKEKLSLSSLMILTLEKTVEGYLQIEDFLYNPEKYRYGYPRHIKKPTLLKTIKRLREKGLIEFIDEDQLLLRLTDKGKDKALLASLKASNKEKWDGRWRIVIFDIPEKRRTTRDLLRLKLKEWGFVKWQNSVWRTKLDCTDQIRLFIRQIGIEKWVKVLESDNIE